MSSGVAPGEKDVELLRSFLETAEVKKDDRLGQLVRSALNSRIKSLSNTSIASREKRKRLGTWGLGEMPIPESAKTLIKDRIKKGQTGKGRWKNLGDASPEDFMITLTRKNKKRKPAPFTMKYLVDHGMKMEDYYKQDAKNRMKFLWSSFYSTPKGKNYIVGKQAKLERMINGLTPKGGMQALAIAQLDDDKLGKLIADMA